jgi:hypothetical protein
MGYFKQLEIADQVEIADRIPAPKPATTHVSYPTRRLYREIERATEQNRRNTCINKLITVFAVGIVITNIALMVYTGGWSR